MVEVTVVGSLSQDLVIKAPRRPGRGETIRGTEFGMFVGGKGNNQALAASRAGAQVSMVGRVGADQFGDNILTALEAEKIDVQHVLRDPEVGTGIAIIVVGQDGDNSIVIAQQANLKLSPADVENARPMLESAKVLLLQMEISLETNIAAAKLAREAGVTVALNPAPAPEDGGLPAELLQSLDIITPNQTEAAQLVCFDVIGVDSAIKAAQILHQAGPSVVIITLGELGALLSQKGRSPSHIAPFRVQALDTTACGDAFCGSLAAALARGEELSDAVLFACSAGALAATKFGAEPSLPRQSEIEQLISVQERSSLLTP